MPPSVRDVQEYSGRFIEQQVCLVEAISRVDELLAQDPAITLADVKTYLAVKAAKDRGDRHAYVICGRIQDCLFAEIDPPHFLICFGCGDLYELPHGSRALPYMRNNFICGSCDGEKYDA